MRRLGDTHCWGGILPGGWGGGGEEEMKGGGEGKREVGRGRGREDNATTSGFPNDTRRIYDGQTGCCYL